MLDVGANAGVYALQFGRWVGRSGRVFAFEPNPETQVILRRHINLNGFDGTITVVPVAVGRAAASVTFSYCGTDGMSRVGAPNPLLGDNPAICSIEIQQTSVDTFCAAQSVVPNLLFFDIEGHEIAALDGARSVVQSLGSKLQIAVELHPSAWANAGSSREMLVTWLELHRRRAVRIDGSISTLREHETVFLEPH